MKKLFLVIGILFLFNISGYTAVDYIDKNFIGETNITTVASVSKQKVAKNFLINFENKYCDTMKMSTISSGEEKFLRFECNCKRCYLLLQEDICNLDAISINVVGKGAKELNINKTYVSKFGVSGKINFGKIKRINNDIDISVTKKQDITIVGIPSIDIIY